MKSNNSLVFIIFFSIYCVMLCTLVGYVFYPTIVYYSDKCVVTEISVDRNGSALVTLRHCYNHSDEILPVCRYYEMEIASDEYYSYALRSYLNATEVLEQFGIERGGGKMCLIRPEHLSVDGGDDERSEVVVTSRGEILIKEEEREKSSTRKSATEKSATKESATKESATKESATKESATKKSATESSDTERNDREKSDTKESLDYMTIRKYIKSNVRGTSLSHPISSLFPFIYLEDIYYYQQKDSYKLVVCTIVITLAIIAVFLIVFQVIVYRTREKRESSLDFIHSEEEDNEEEENDNRKNENNNRKNEDKDNNGNKDDERNEEDRGESDTTNKSIINGNIINKSGDEEDAGENVDGNAGENVDGNIESVDGNIHESVGKGEHVNKKSALIHKGSGGHKEEIYREEIYREEIKKEKKGKKKARRMLNRYSEDIHQQRGYSIESDEEEKQGDSGEEEEEEEKKRIFFEQQEIFKDIDFKFNKFDKEISHQVTQINENMQVKINNIMNYFQNTKETNRGGERGEEQKEEETSKRI